MKNLLKINLGEKYLQEKKARREENEKRRKENAMKSEVVQKVSNEKLTLKTNN